MLLFPSAQHPYPTTSLNVSKPQPYISVEPSSAYPQASVNETIPPIETPTNEAMNETSAYNNANQYHATILVWSK